MDIYVINGPNLEILEYREADLYGSESLSQIEEYCFEKEADNRFNFKWMQSSEESKLLSFIHEAIKKKVEGVIINPAAFTHTSVALRDALLSVNIPFIEVHLSNVHAREPFRHHSYFSDVAAGVIVGLGAMGYSLALTAAINLPKSHK